jgi:hypothetical protein
MLDQAHIQYQACESHRNISGRVALFFLVMGVSTVLAFIVRPGSTPAGYTPFLVDFCLFIILISATVCFVWLMILYHARFGPGYRPVDFGSAGVDAKVFILSGSGGGDDDNGGDGGGDGDGDGGGDGHRHGDGDSAGDNDHAKLGIFDAGEIADTRTPWT